MPSKKRTAAEDAVPSAGRLFTGKRAKKSNDLSGLMEMPLDIWFAMCKWLSPEDVLHMARASKTLRDALMSQGFITAWRHAREQSHPGLPDPSPVLSEPAWANLIFGNRCHVCVKAIRRVIDWELGIRICQKCIPEALKSVNDLSQDERAAGIDEMLFTMPACQYKPFVREDVFYVPQYEKIKAHYDSLETDTEKAAYVSEGRLTREKWLLLSKAGRKWVCEEAKKHELERDHTRLGRRMQIFNKLREEGYAEELEDDDCLHDIDDHPFIKQSRPLTDRIWNNQLDSMIVFMNDVRAKRLKRKRRQTILRRQDEAINALKASKGQWLAKQNLVRPLTPGILMNGDIGPCDWLAFPQIHALIELPGYDAIGPQRWSDGALSKLGWELMVGWNEAITCGLFLIQEEAHPDFGHLESLSRVTYAYTCSSCSMPLFYPDVIFHPCLTITKKFINYRHFDDDDEEEYIPAFELPKYGPYKRQAWSADCLTADARLNAIVVNVVELLGLDPNVATVKDLDDLDVYIHLFNCPRVNAEIPGVHSLLALYLKAMKRAIPLTDSIQPRKYFFGWRKLVLALYEHGLTEPLRKGENVDLIDASTVSEPYIAKIQDTQDWYCVVCRDTRWEDPPMSLEEIQIHLVNRHGYNREDQREGVHYYRPLQPSEVARTSLVVPA